MYQTLKQLTALTAVSGGEAALRGKIKEILSPHVDEIQTDALGNLIALRRGNAPDPKKIMLTAHIDEVGLVATYIEENGLIRFGTVGDMDLSTAAFARVQSERGVYGILAPAADTEPKDYTSDRMYIDVGAKNSRTVMRRVQIGDRFAICPSLCRLEQKRLCGHPLDRIGCAVLLDIAKKLPPPKDDIYFVCTTQAKTGHRGAKSAAFSVEPDLALVFDLAPTACLFGKDASPKLGGGAAVLVKDAATLCDLRLFDRMLALAKREKIAVQPIALAEGSTDVAAIQNARAGCAAGALAIPARYMKTANAVADLDDAHACAALALKLIEDGI